MKNIIKLMSVIILLMVVSCNSFMKKNHKANATIEGSWVLKSLEGKDLVIEKDQKAPELTFDLAKKDFYGSDGCNRIFGKIETSDNKLQFKNIAGTLMACEDMTIPYQYNALLEKTVQFEITDSALLTLKDKQNKSLLTFYKLTK